MADRLNVLISAYACEPGRGSEPEVGWQWAVQLSRHHDITVLTRANNRAAIEEGVRRLGVSGPELRFVYHDLPFWAQRAKHAPGGIWWYYALWQRSARRVVAAQCRAGRFDVLHHLTIASFRWPAAIWDQEAASIWGPIGGVEPYPWRLMTGRHPADEAAEAIRNVANRWHGSAWGRLRARARRSTVVLAATPDMQATLARRGVPSRLVPTIGIELPAAPPPVRAVSAGPLRLLYVGNLLLLKGLDLLLEALAASGSGATLTLVGDGRFRPAAEGLVRRLGLGERVRFRGWLARAAVAGEYATHDLFCFPSLHDTGGFAVLEAMAQRLPVVCVAAGGPALAVGETAGVAVKVGPRREMIGALSAALRRYDAHRTKLVADGEAAYRRVTKDYAWPRKAEQMAELYREVAARARRGESAGSGSTL